MINLAFGGGLKKALGGVSNTPPKIALASSYSVATCISHHGAEEARLVLLRRGGVEQLLGLGAHGARRKTLQLLGI